LGAAMACGVALLSPVIAGILAGGSVDGEF
jgi:hypothetical protein